MLEGRQQRAQRVCCWIGFITKRCWMISGGEKRKFANVQGWNKWKINWRLLGTTRKFVNVETWAFWCSKCSVVFDYFCLYSEKTFETSERWYKWILNLLLHSKNLRNETLWKIVSTFNFPSFVTFHQSLKIKTFKVSQFHFQMTVSNVQQIQIPFPTLSIIERQEICMIEWSAGREFCNFRENVCLNHSGSFRLLLRD